MVRTPIFMLLRLFVLSATLLALAGCGQREYDDRNVNKAYNDNLHVRHGMLKRLWTQQYAELDESLDQQYQLYQEGKLKAGDFVRQLWTLRMADAQFAGRFETWVATRPDSHWADLAHGLFLLESAWKARGSDIVARTSENGMAAMRGLAESAARTLRRAAGKGVSPALYGGGLISAGMLLNDTADSEEIVHAAMSADPKFWMAPIAYFQQLYPQWGGSEEAMQCFIDGIRGEHPQLAAYLDADMLWRRGLDFESDGQAEPAIQRYESAISIYPHADALKNLGELYVHAGRCKEAVKVLETNLEKNDKWDLWTLEMLHQAQVCGGDPAGAQRTLNRRDELIRRYRQGE